MPPELKINLVSTFQQWADDNSYVTYVQVVVDEGVAVPNEFVQDGRIILNISSQATNNLSFTDNTINFKARFAGLVREVYIPIERVNAIFIKDTNIGLGLPLSDSPILTVEDETELAQKDKPKTTRHLRKIESTDNVVKKISKDKPQTYKTKKNTQSKKSDKTITNKTQKLSTTKSNTSNKANRTSKLKKL